MKVSIFSSVTVTDGTIFIFAWLQVRSMNIERACYVDIVQRINAYEVYLSPNSKEKVVKSTLAYSDGLMILNGLSVD